MIIDLELTNFKQHEKLYVAFKEGLIGLRGPNEAGKSSIFHAANYAFFGARALPMSLAETGTWGKPESSLKVKQKFSVDDVVYQIVRSKSGAELTAPGLLVTGQSEVTKYVEGLFKVNADAAAKLMIASQGKLRGALESKEAIPLIEKLASINLIDELITKVQEQLPSGSTKQLAENLAKLNEEVKPEADFSLQEANLEMLQLEVDNAKDAIKFCDEAADALAVYDSQQLIAKAELLKAKVALAETAVLGAKARLEKPAVSFEDNTAELYEKAEKQKQEEHDLAAYQTFLKHVPHNETAEGDIAAELLGCKNTLVSFRESKALLTSEILTAKLGRINEDSCTLCGKLLQDVPEVVTKNLDCDTRKTKAEQELADTDNVITQTNLQVAKLEGLLALDRSTKLLQAQLAKWTELVQVKGMHQIKWTAAIPAKDPTDYVKLLAVAKTQQAAVASDVAQRDVAQKNLQAQLKWLLEEPVIDTTEAVAVLAKWKIVKDQLDAARARLAVANDSLTKAKHSLDILKTQFQGKLDTYNAGRVFATKLKEDIATYDANNALIKRLREARPIVAARLWSVVLHAVSHYFSAIRGTPTVITMGADSFMADGKPIEGLSGSTLDSLGLAIRIALGKTFLPSLDFLLLDEPAQGMDDERESAMLGVLAGAEYKQVVVVTHSSLADSFASDIVQL